MNEEKRSQFQRPAAHQIALFIVAWIFAYWFAMVARLGEGVSVLYLPAGLTTWAGFIWGWWGLILGFVASLLNDALGLSAYEWNPRSIINELRHGVILGATGMILRHWVGTAALLCIREMFRFLLVSGLGAASSAVALALIGVVGLGTDDLLRRMFLAFIGDLTGIVILVPMLCLLLDPEARPAELEQPSLMPLAEATIASIAGVWLAFALPIQLGINRPLETLLLIPLGWIALRRGPLMTMIAMFEISVGSVLILWFYAIDQETFAYQILMVAILALTLLLCAAVWERDGAMRKLVDRGDLLSVKVDDRTAELHRVIEELEVEVEERRRAEAAAEAALEVKDRFLSNMSHEIRTPMNGIIGLSQLLLDIELGEKQRDFAVKIHRSAEGLHQLLNDVLDLSKVERGQVEIKARPVDLRSLLQLILDLVERQARSKDLRLELDISSEISTWIIADGTHLRHILLNLVGNAVKFTDAGLITIRVRPPQGPLLFIEVQDSGPGIPESDRESIYEAFTRSEANGGLYRGTGLGLAIARRFAKEMSAALSHRPAKGGGTVFTLKLEYLPTQAPGEEDRPSPMSLDQRGERTILVVDDEPINRTVAVDLLDRLGYRTMEAASGTEATEMVRVMTPSMVLLDLMMPEPDGFATARAIRKVVGDELPIYALTAMSRTEVGEKLEQAGFSGLLVKPFRLKELEALVDSVLGPPKT